MLALALSVACSLVIVAVLKHAERGGLDRMGLLTASYAASVGLGAVRLASEGGPGGGVPPGMLALGVATGALFIGGFAVFARAIREAGAGRATGVMRLSVVVPVLASWAVWGERPGVGQVAGLVLAGAAFVLLARAGSATESEQGARGRRALVLGLLFAAGGAADVAMKAFDEAYAPTGGRALFLLLVFGVAFGIGLVVVLGRRMRGGGWPGTAALGWGAVLGLANYGSAAFMLAALEGLPGPLVFPAANVAIVLGAAGLGALVWKERATRAHAAGLALAATALVLLLQ